MKRQQTQINGATMYDDIPYVPKFARVIVERQLFNKRASGLIIPDEAKKKYAENKGVVVAYGPTAENVELGETVCWGNYSGASIDFKDAGFVSDDRELYMIADEDVLFTFREDA